MKLESGFQLVLENVFYVPSFRRNLISVSVMDKIGYWFNIRNGKVNIFLDSQLIGHCILSHNLYQLSLHSNIDEINVVSKRPLVKERSFKLWHKRLGHISKERVERLVKDNILPTLDFDDLDTCVDCIRGKMTKTKKKGANRSLNVLAISHTDVSGTYSPTICGNKYFFYIY